MAMVDLRDSRLLRDVAPPLTSSPDTTTTSSDEEDSHSGSSATLGRPPLTPLRSKLHADEVFVKNMVGLLNRRGYNVRDSALETSIASSTPSITRSSSITSTGSVSSVMLALREPNHGQTPLHIAVRKGDTHVLDALLEHESAEELLDAPDFNGNTALHFAAGNWRHPQALSITDRLLQAGADVNAENKRGLSPLAVHMLTMKIDNPTLVLKLLEAGADPNAEAEGVAVLHLAARRDLPAIAGVLVGFGASMLALNSDGLMCYEVAPNRVKQFMIRSIYKAPAFVPMHQRSSCMRCKSPTLLTPKKAFGNLLKKVLGMPMQAHQCNCYHCGMIFCSQCLKASAAVPAIPFVREELDAEPGKIKTCRLCEAILLERKRKQASQHAFDMHLMGFKTSI